LKTEFLLPPLPEQKKIASILTSVDEVIENTQKQIDKLQDLKKATMNELLTKGIGHTEFKDSELGRIPKSWEVKRLDEVAEKIWIGLVTTMTKYYVTEGVPLIRNSDIKEGGIDVNGLINLEKEIRK
jgi:type I restriction enzyme S subunit